MPSVDRIVPPCRQLGVATAQSIYENGDFVNPVAAMPSLHAAFPLMLLLFFWSAGRWVRLGLGLYRSRWPSRSSTAASTSCDILAAGRWPRRPCPGRHGSRRAPALFSG